MMDDGALTGSSASILRRGDSLGFCGKFVLSIASQRLHNQ